MSEQEETINVEEETVEEKDWTEEFKVAGDELVNTVKSLLHEATVRRIVVRNEEKNINLEIPLALGVVGIALLPVWSALALIAALVTDCTVLVERSEKSPESVEAAPEG